MVRKVVRFGDLAPLGGRLRYHVQRLISIQCLKGGKSFIRSCDSVVRSCLRFKKDPDALKRSLVRS